MKLRDAYSIAIILATGFWVLSGCNDEPAQILLTENETLNKVLQSAEAVSILNLDETSLDTIVLKQEDILGRKSAESIPPPKSPAILNGLVKSGNYLYTGDKWSSCIWMLDLNKKAWVRKVGRKGRGPGEFMELAGILGNSRNIFSMDMANARVQEYDHKLNLIDTHLEVPGFPDMVAATDSVFYSPTLVLDGDKVIQPYRINNDFTRMKTVWPRLIPPDMEPYNYNRYNIAANSDTIVIIQHGLPYIFLLDAQHNVKHAIYAGSSIYKDLEFPSAEPIPMQRKDGPSLAGANYMRTPLLEEDGAITFSIGPRIYQLELIGNHYEVKRAACLSFEELDKTTGSRLPYVRAEMVRHLIAEEDTLYITFPLPTDILRIGL